MTTERLYVVQWSDDGTSWWVLWDDMDNNRKVPAAYDTADKAERRRSAMADLFPDEASYRVVGYEHPSEV